MGATKEVAASCTLKGHSDWAQFCAVSADGGLAISTSKDHTARIWDLRTEPGKELHVLTEHTDRVWCCTMTKDGEYVATACDDGKVRVWQLDVDDLAKEPTMVHELERPDMSRAYGCAIGASGTKLVATFLAKNPASDGVDGEVVVFDIQNGSIDATFQSTRGLPLMCDASSDAEIAVVGVWCRSKTAYAMALRMVDLKIINSWKCDENGHRPAVAVNATGDIVCVEDASSTWVYSVDPKHADSVNGEVKASPPVGPRGGTYVGMNSNGDRVVLATTQKRHIVVDPFAKKEGVEIASLIGPTEGARGCAITPDGNTVVACSEEGIVRKYSVPPHPDSTGPNAILDGALRQEISSMAAEPSGEDETEAHLENAKPLETALKNALHTLSDADKSSVDEAALVHLLKTSKAESVVEMLAGHSLVLLSARSGAIPAWQLSQLMLGSPEMRSRLYMSGCEDLQSDAERLLARQILVHAKQHDILPEGFAGLNREQAPKSLSFTEGDGKAELGSKIAEFAQAVTCADTTSTSPFRSDPELAKKTLRTHLDSLDHAIKAQDRASIYANASLCQLAMVAWMGGPVGLVDNADAKVALLEQGDAVQGLVERLERVSPRPATCADLTGFQTLRAALSDRLAMRALPDEEARKAFKNAFEESLFKSQDTVDGAIVNRMAVVSQDPRGMHLLHFGEAPRRVSFSTHTEAPGASATLQEEAGLFVEKVVDVVSARKFAMQWKKAALATTDPNSSASGERDSDVAEEQNVTSDTASEDLPEPIAKDVPRSDSEATDDTENAGAEKGAGELPGSGSESAEDHPSSESADVSNINPDDTHAQEESPGIALTEELSNYLQRGCLLRSAVEEDAEIAAAKRAFEEACKRSGESTLTYIVAEKEIAILLVRRDHLGIGYIDESLIENEVLKANKFRRRRIESDSFSDAYLSVLSILLGEQEEISPLWEEAYAELAGSYASCTKARFAANAIADICSEDERLPDIDEQDALEMFAEVGYMPKSLIGIDVFMSTVRTLLRRFKE